MGLGKRNLFLAILYKLWLYVCKSSPADEAAKLILNNSVHWADVASQHFLILILHLSMETLPSWSFTIICVYYENQHLFPVIPSQNAFCFIQDYLPDRILAMNLTTCRLSKPYSEIKKASFSLFLWVKTYQT